MNKRIFSMNYYLAPMMGYTDCYFRSLIENIYGNRVLTFSEMIVDKAIIHNEVKTINKHFLEKNKSAIQIAGSDPQEIKRTINILNRIDIIKHVNFNLGCPSSRVQENMLGLALTQNYDLVKKCLFELINYKHEVSVKCRLGLGMNEDKNYIFSYLNLFKDIGIKKIFIHCRNGVLNLDTKKNRTIPQINYELFLECSKKFPEMELIPNGEVNNLDTFNSFKSKNINKYMIGRQFAKDALFLEKLKLEKINDKTSLVLDSIKELDNYKYLNINLLKKSLFTLINNISNSKGIKKDISIIDNTKDLLNYI
ncbi:tRNA-dihydrouridine synthase family protein, partial [Alphaproteobacteria bacterium]|nr:tRNA-dihydrouridine synthase family protein [Alphaproteobacteria bacterium]